MNHSTFDLLYDVMPPLMTTGARNFFRDAFRVIEFEGYVDSVSELLDNTGRTVGGLIFSADEPLLAHEIEAFKRLGREGHNAVDRWHGFETLYAQGVFSRLIDSFLTYVTDLLASIYRNNPHALRSGEQVRVDEVLRHDTMDSFVDFLVERKVHQLSYQGMQTLHSTLERELAFSLFEVPAELKHAVLLIEKRNLLTHARGVVNRLFLQRQPTAEYKLGERLNFDRTQITDVLIFLTTSVARIDVSAVQKFQIDQSALQKRPERS